MFPLGYDGVKEAKTRVNDTNIRASNHEHLVFPWLYKDNIAN